MQANCHVEEKIDVEALNALIHVSERSTSFKIDTSWLEEEGRVVLTVGNSMTDQTIFFIDVEGE